MNETESEHRRNYAVVDCRATIEADIDAAWSRIGGFGDLGRFLDVDCSYLAGTGELGSVRRVGPVIVEPMVGKTRHSYTYAQTEGPMAPFAYHGTVALEPDGGRCRLVYTLAYDETDMDPERRTAERERISRRFEGAVAAMKRAAEADAAPVTGNAAAPSHVN